MRAELILFGRHVNMGAQKRRRTLVIALYVLLAVLFVVLWALTHWRGTGVWMMGAVLLACRFFLGGYYTKGLVKPFNGKPPREQAIPSSVLELKLLRYKPVLDADEQDFKNDERELAQRNHAHYLAYQAIGVAVLVPFAYATLRSVRSNLLAWVPLPADEVYYALLLLILLLFLTLPQTILLWVEPDMEAET
jgi:hypothetical protein